MSESNGYASTDVLLAKLVPEIAEVFVPRFGRFRIATMSELDRSEIEYEVSQKDGLPTREAKIRQGAYIKALMVTKSVCDAEGRLCFTSAQAQAMIEADSYVINVLVDAIMPHCGWSGADIEKIAGNSEGDPGEDSQ